MIEIEVYGLGAIGNVPSWMYGVILAVLVVGIGDIVLTQKTRKMQKIATLLLVGYVVLVFCSAVVFREERTASAINLIPLSSYFFIAENSYLWEVTSINLLNIVMFLPVGILLKYIGSPAAQNSNKNIKENYSNGVTWKRVLILGLVLSASIELSQFVFKKGLCEVDDIIHNVIGCLLGYGIATLTINVLRPLTRNKQP